MFERLTPEQSATVHGLFEKQRGIYQKYRVERVSDPTGKHRDCAYFVLDPQHDPNAVPALLAYADACVAEYPALAADLRAWAERAETSGESASALLREFLAAEAFHCPHAKNAIRVPEGLIARTVRFLAARAPAERRAEKPLEAALRKIRDADLRDADPDAPEIESWKRLVRTLQDVARRALEPEGGGPCPEGVRR